MALAILPLPVPLLLLGGFGACAVHRVNTLQIVYDRLANHNTCGLNTRYTRCTSHKCVLSSVVLLGGFDVIQPDTKFLAT